MAVEQDKYMNEKEVSNLTGIAVSTLQRDRHKGQGMLYIKIGRKVIYDRHEVEAYLEKHKVIPHRVGLR